MFRFLTKRKMHGGLVFGPAAWMPERIETTFDPQSILLPESDAKPAAPTETTTEKSGATAGGGEQALAPPPKNPAELLALIEKLGVGRTSPIIPALLDQLNTVKDSPKELVLDLLPAMPESALGGALSRLALEDLANGLAAIERAVGSQRTHIALDRHDVRCWRHWRHILRHWRTGDSSSNGRKRLRRPRLRLFLNRYPQAQPTLLLHALFGIHLPVGTSPMARHCLVVDPVICWAIGRHLRTGWRFTERPVQLFLQDCSSPRLVMARLGETIGELCRRHGLTDDLATRQVIINGMLAGRCVHPGSERINPDTESLTIRQRAAPEEPAPCLSCGWCINVCPTGLTPVRLMELSQSLLANGKPPSRAAREALHCLGCGLCAYVCPTRLPLMEMTLQLRGRLVAAPDKPAQANS